MAEAIGARLVRSRFFRGFVSGAALGATVSGLLANKFLRNPDQSPSAAASQPEEPLPPQQPPLRETGPKSILERYGFPAAGTQIRYYTNHALSYDQAKRVPRWVIEHISKYKTSGSADRKHCKFKADPNIPSMFSAVNEDYVGSGWSRGHMAPAGNNKYSPEAMAETFYLSNIVPQNYENNAGFWNRVEMYCRDLTERFEDVWIVSGPLMLPQLDEDGKKKVTYQEEEAQILMNDLPAIDFNAKQSEGLQPRAKGAPLTATESATQNYGIAELEGKTWIIESNPLQHVRFQMS